MLDPPAVEITYGMERILMGLGGIPLLGHAELLRWLLILAPLPIAGIGVWRLLQPFGSRNAGVVGTIAYLANPVAYNAFARGSWSTLVLFAAAPWVLRQLARSIDALLRMMGNNVQPVG